MSKAFNKEAILEAIADYVDEGITLEDIQDYAFNLDPWIISTYKAAKALDQFNEEDQMYELTYFNGVFGAIQYVRDYETNKFGEAYTNSSDPEKLASVVAYINGEQILSELAEKLNIEFDDKLTEKQVKQLSSVETMQKLLS